MCVRAWGGLPSVGTPLSQHLVLTHLKAVRTLCSQNSYARCTVWARWINSSISSPSLSPRVGRGAEGSQRVTMAWPCWLLAPIWDPTKDLTRASDALSHPRNQRSLGAPGWELGSETNVHVLLTHLSAHTHPSSLPSGCRTVCEGSACCTGDFLCGARSPAPTVTASVCL